MTPAVTDKRVIWDAISCHPSPQSPLFTSCALPHGRVLPKQIAPAAGPGALGDEATTKKARAIGSGLSACNCLPFSHPVQEGRQACYWALPWGRVRMAWSPSTTS